MNFDILSDLFDELVPPMGPAGNLAGEAVRAASRIGYRYFNDGDRIGVRYGKETCNPAARFLIEETNAEIAEIVQKMWGKNRWTDEKYEEKLEELLYAVRDFVESDPSLRDEPCDDYWDWKEPEDSW